MNGVCERSVEVNGQPCRVWEKGSSEAIGFLAGLGGLQQWPPFLDRLAERRRVVVPSIPGFPGANGHDLLDTQLDWVLAVHDLLTAAGLDGADLIGVSVGGALAADVAACWPSSVRRLVLVAPLGLFDPAEPVTDIFAQRPGATRELVCSDPSKFDAATGPGTAIDVTESEIIAVRASEAAARLLWPLLDTRVAKRLPRIIHQTLLVWGAEDKVLPFSYAARFASLISGETTTVKLQNAGHQVDLDVPDALAEAILSALS